MNGFFPVYYIKMQKNLTFFKFRQNFAKFRNFAKISPNLGISPKLLKFRQGLQNFAIFRNLAKISPVWQRWLAAPAFSFSLEVGWRWRKGKEEEGKGKERKEQEEEIALHTQESAQPQPLTKKREQKEKEESTKKWGVAATAATPTRPARPSRTSTRSRTPPSTSLGSPPAVTKRPRESPRHWKGGFPPRLSTCPAPQARTL